MPITLQIYIFFNYAQLFYTKKHPFYLKFSDKSIHSPPLHAKFFRYLAIYKAIIGFRLAFSFFRKTFLQKTAVITDHRLLKT